MRFGCLLYIKDHLAFIFQLRIVNVAADLEYAMVVMHVSTVQNAFNLNEYRNETDAGLLQELRIFILLFSIFVFTDRVQMNIIFGVVFVRRNNNFRLRNQNRYRLTLISKITSL